MSGEVVVLVVTALLAVVAVIAAGVAVVVLRRVREVEVARAATPSQAVALTAEPFEAGDVAAEPRPVELVRGRVVATLTEQDLLEARLSRPSARLAVYAHGITHALRPESRDRITALVRREYRRRRSIRLKAARRALWSVSSDTLQKPVDDVDWLGTHERASLPRAAGE